MCSLAASVQGQHVQSGCLGTGTACAAWLPRYKDSMCSLAASVQGQYVQPGRAVKNLPNMKSTRFAALFSTCATSYLSGIHTVPDPSREPDLPVVRALGGHQEGHLLRSDPSRPISPLA
ncbi:hypothetical protein RRG08_052095 [Elysia crispata]|uniref:Uncharacterized protein n=1 Tax=Elysia crispata TaxID=231223 RepID=A0AAE1DS74_9GAST|nr:hypothetical protein RRG08_052095 [Elysia crispata]